MPKTLQQTVRLPAPPDELFDSAMSFILDASQPIELDGKKEEGEPLEEDDGDDLDHALDGLDVKTNG